MVNTLFTKIKPSKEERSYKGNEDKLDFEKH